MLQLHLIYVSLLRALSCWPGQLPLYFALCSVFCSLQKRSKWASDIVFIFDKKSGLQTEFEMEMDFSFQGKKKTKQNIDPRT